MIEKALQKAVIAAVGASDIPAFPIKALGRTFNIPDDQKWLELIIIPNDRSNETWGETTTYQGLLRLILHWPVDDSGVYDPINFLKSVLRFFKKDRTFNADGMIVKILDVPSLMSILEEGKENLYPASVRYTCNFF